MVKLKFLVHSHWITFPTQSCLVLFSYSATIIIIIIIIIILHPFADGFSRESERLDLLSGL